MSPEMGRAAARIAMFIMVTAAILIPLSEPGSAGQVMSVLSFVVGVLFLAVIAILARLTSR